MSTGNTAPVLKKGSNPALHATAFQTRRLSSFSVSSFRLFFLASLFLYGGINSLLVVRGFLVFDLTGSYADLGMLALATLIPSFFSTLYGGVVADRLPKTVFVAGGLIVMGLFALWITVLLYLESLSLWQVMVSAAVHGGVFGLISPAWYSVMPEVVPKHLIMNAVSLNLGGQNMTRLVVPAICGFLLGITGVDTVYLFMASLFIIAGLLMARVKLSPEKQVLDDKIASNPVVAFLEGLRYTRSQPAVASLVLANILIAALSLPFLMLLPGYVKEVLEAGPEVLGYIVSITSIGALTSTFYMSSMRALHRGKIFLGACVVMGAAFCGFAAMQSLWSIYTVVLLIGAGLAIRQSLVAALCQMYVEASYRGRVSSLLSMQMTAGQVGTFAIGWCSEVVSAPVAFTAMGIMLIIICGTFYAFSGSLRHLH